MDGVREFKLKPLDVQVGDDVVRMIAGELEMPVKVTSIEDGVVTCGAWTFDQKTGAEIDEYLNWGPPPKATGSFIVKKEAK